MEVKIDALILPSGKYSLFGLPKLNSYTLMMYIKWKIWGTQYADNKEKDVLKFDVKRTKSDTVTEKLTYTIDKDGKVAMNWGDLQLSFWVK